MWISCHILLESFDLKRGLIYYRLQWRKSISFFFCQEGGPILPETATRDFGGAAVSLPPKEVIHETSPGVSKAEGSADGEGISFFFFAWHVWRGRRLPILFVHETYNLT